MPFWLRKATPRPCPDHVASAAGCEVAFRRVVQKAQNRPIASCCFWTGCKWRLGAGPLVNCLQSVNHPAVPFGASVLVLADAGLVLVGWVPAFEFIASATQRLCSVHACDPATERGYVYLPGKGDKFYESNTFLIFRG